MNNNLQAFIALVKAGLWDKKAFISQFIEVDYAKLLSIAEEQSVVGLVTAGLDKVADVKGPQADVFQFIGRSLQIEQHNLAMNQFVANLIDKLRKANIYAILVKGQGVAQCYERPHWRSCGDVDLLLSEDNYEKAKEYLTPLSSGGIPERHYSKELGLYIKDWLVELHGTLRTGLSYRVDKEVDATQRVLFYNGNVRSWNNNGTIVFMPAPNEDVFFVFTHFIKHFYKERMTLRQVCDWCRLLWTYKTEIDIEILGKRIRNAGLMAEWKAFAAFAVQYLDMPTEAMPFYSSEKKWSKKADQLFEFIIKCDERRKIQDTFTVSQIFPLSVVRFAPGIFFNVNWLKIKERMFMK